MLSAGLSKPPASSSSRKMAEGRASGLKEGGDNVPEPLTDLARRECRWPITEDKEAGNFFCAAPVAAAGKSYCVTHAALAYLPWRQPAPRRDKREAIRELEFIADLAGI